MPVLSTRIVLGCFYLLIFYSEKFSTDVNVNLNLSIVVLPLENKIYIFAPPCNILYI